MIANLAKFWMPLTLIVALALDIDHRLFRQHFELDDLHAMDPYVPGGYTMVYALTH